MYGGAPYLVGELLVLELCIPRCTTRTLTTCSTSALCSDADLQHVWFSSDYYDPVWQFPNWNSETGLRTPTLPGRLLCCAHFVSIQSLTLVRVFLAMALLGASWSCRRLFLAMAPCSEHHGVVGDCSWLWRHVRSIMEL